MRGRRRRHNFWKRWQEWREKHQSPEARQEFFREFLGTTPHKHWVFGGRRFRPWQMGEMGFNPFIAMLLSKGGGLLPLYLLHLLGRAELYGNELMQKIAERTEGGWFSNPGAVYPLLTLLEEQGYIKGEWEDPDKRTVRRYHITEAGREELERLKDIIRPKIQEAIEVLRDLLADLEVEEEGEED